MTARKMTVKGVEIPASVLDAVDAKMAECTSRPFTAQDVTVWVRSLGVSVVGSIGDETFQVADRIMQRHRKSGRIMQGKRGQWLWVAATSELSHGEVSDWSGRAYTMARHMIMGALDREEIHGEWETECVEVCRTDAIAYMRGHGWLTFTDADLDAATEGEDIRWA